MCCGDPKDRPVGSKVNLVRPKIAIKNFHSPKYHKNNNYSKQLEYIFGLCCPCRHFKLTLYYLLLHFFIFFIMSFIKLFLIQIRTYNEDNLVRTEQNNQNTVASKVIIILFDFILFSQVTQILYIIQLYIAIEITDILMLIITSNEENW